MKQTNHVAFVVVAVLLLLGLLCGIAIFAAAFLFSVSLPDQAHFFDAPTQTCVIFADVG